MIEPIITIPSYRRPNSRIFRKLAHLPWKKKVFLRKSDVQAYRQAGVLGTGFEIVQLPEWATDLGLTRKYIIEWAGPKNWLWMLDDDISHVESLVRKSDGSYNSMRIEANKYNNTNNPPRFEEAAMAEWYFTARDLRIPLSSPNHRAYDRSYHGSNRINRSACMQCILVATTPILRVGNYDSVFKTGVEDLYIQYRLMEAGYETAKFGFMEYSCPTVGQGQGGCNADLDPNLPNRYETYVQAFLDNVCNDPAKIRVKTTHGGVKSIAFVWSGWKGEVIPCY